MSRYEDVVQNFKVNIGSPLKINPRELSRRSRYPRSSSLLSSSLAMTLATRLALRPASDLAFAEDAIILHGSKADPFLKKNISDEDGSLEKQDGLFKDPPR